MNRFVVKLNTDFPNDLSPKTPSDWQNTLISVDNSKVGVRGLNRSQPRDKPVIAVGDEVYIYADKLEGLMTKAKISSVEDTESNQFSIREVLLLHPPIRLRREHKHSDSAVFKQLKRYRHSEIYCVTKEEVREFERVIFEEGSQWVD